MRLAPMKKPLPRGRKGGRKPLQFYLPTLPTITTDQPAADAQLTAIGETIRVTLPDLKTTDKSR